MIRIPKAYVLIRNQWTSSRTDGPDGATDRRTRGISARWRRIFRIGMTVFALLAIGSIVSWRDRVVLTDGRHGIVASHAGGRLEFTQDSMESARAEFIESRQISSLELGVFSMLASARIGWGIGFMACCAIAGALLIMRWRCVIEGVAAPPSVRWCVVIWARSQVIGCLPTSQLGSDLFRIQQLTTALELPAASIGITLCERVIGLSALGLVAAIGLIASGLCTPSWLLLVAVLSGVALFLMRGVSPLCKTNGQRGSPRDLHKRSWQQTLSDAFRPVVAFANQPGRLALAILFSIAIHLVSAFSFVTIDRAIGLSTPVWCYLVTVPALALAHYLPVHIAGIGVLEGGLGLALSILADRTGSEALAIAAGVRIAGLFWFAVLAGSFLWEPARGPRTLRKECGAVKCATTPKREAGQATRMRDSLQRPCSREAVVAEDGTSTSSWGVI